MDEVDQSLGACSALFEAVTQFGMGDEPSS